MIYSTEKNIKDLGDKVSPEDKSKAEAAIAELRRALEGGDVENIKAKSEALKQISYKIAEEVYKTQGPQTPPGGEADGPNPQDSGSSMGGGNTRSAEDADYEVVDDDKK
jgi:molecular chaperone DnaK